MTSRILHAFAGEFDISGKLPVTVIVIDDDQNTYKNDFPLIQR